MRFIRGGPSAAQEITKYARGTGQVVATAALADRKDTLGYEFMGIGQSCFQNSRMRLEEVEYAAHCKLKLAQFDHAILTENKRLGFLTLSDELQFISLASTFVAASDCKLLRTLHFDLGIDQFVLLIGRSTSLFSGDPVNLSSPLSSVRL